MTDNDAPPHDRPLDRNPAFAEQLKEVREADLLVGIHGAGLSHVMFMSDGATLVELATNNLGMFSGFANWRPRVKYEEIRIGGGDGDFYVQTERINAVAAHLLFGHLHITDVPVAMLYTGLPLQVVGVTVYLPMNRCKDAETACADESESPSV